MAAFAGRSSYFAPYPRCLPGRRAPAMHVYTAFRLPSGEDSQGAAESLATREKRRMILCTAECEPKLNTVIGRAHTKNISAIAVSTRSIIALSRMAHCNVHNMYCVSYM